MPSNETSSLSSIQELVAPHHASRHLRSRWQRIMRDAIRSPDELCQRLQLPREFTERARQAATDFPLFVPLGYLRRMRPGDIADPLLRQVLPLPIETDARKGFSVDPVADGQATLVPGLLKKYAGRALMVTTGTCAVHCRYCFRRHFPYAVVPRGFDAWQPALAQLASDPTIHEVILSGGDPLTLVDDRLAWLAERLAAIGHLRRLRIHSRLPIIIPERVGDELLTWLRGTRLTTIMVVHANHPRELDRDVEAALGRIVDAGVPVLNQAVLLGGVNDSADVLVELCERLADLRVVPYYLHQLDRVSGAAHFEVPLARGLAIHRQLRRRLPGYAVPRYVQERPGDEYKWELS